MTEVPKMLKGTTNWKSNTPTNNNHTAENAMLSRTSSCDLNIVYYRNLKTIPPDQYKCGTILFCKD